MTSEILSRSIEIREAAAGCAKPVERFDLDRDPLTGWPIEPAPQIRFAIPVYDAETHELREFLP